LEFTGSREAIEIRIFSLAVGLLKRLLSRIDFPAPSDAPTVDERDGEHSQNEPSYQCKTNCTKLRLSGFHRRARTSDHIYGNECARRDVGIFLQSSEGERHLLVHR
jgi:hypothetical protein